MYAYMKISLASIILYTRIYSEDFEENKSLIISLKCVNAVVRVHDSTLGELLELSGSQFILLHRDTAQEGALTAVSGRCSYQSHCWSQGAPKMED